MADRKQVSASKGKVTCNRKLPGKTVLITGANTGIGFETAIDLAKREAKVLIACRNMEKGEQARQLIVEASGSDNVHLKKLDLSSLESVRKLAEDVNRTEERLDILINNAGVMMCPQSETKEGFETHFGVNHLGHFLLTNKLLDLIKKSTPSRIINLSSMAHRSGEIHWGDLNLKKNYTSGAAYGQSKLMNILFSRELSKKLEGTGVTVNSVHPGVVNTELWRHSGTPSGNGFFMTKMVSLFSKMTWFFKTTTQGAQTSIYCAVAPELENVTGKYFSDCKVARETDAARDDEAAKRLWEISEDLTGLKTGQEQPEC